MPLDIAEIIGKRLNLPRKQVASTLRLLDDGATIPFIARYRKEMTGSLDEVAQQYPHAGGRVGGA